MTPNPTPNVVQDLLRIHRALTRGLTVGLEKGAQFQQDGFPDPLTRKGYTDYLQALVAVLSSHHLAEDEIAFPTIQAKLPAAPFGKLRDDHQAIEALLSPIQQAIPQVAAGEQAALVELVDNLQRVKQLWDPHILIEETHFTAQALDPVMPAEEQIGISIAMSKYSAEHATPGFLAVPFVLYNLDPADRAALASMMPPVVINELVPKAWKDQWAAMKPFLLE